MHFSKQFILHLGLFFLFISCNSKTQRQENFGGISATDSRNKVIHLEQEAQRVVALFEPAVDHIYMLQASNVLVGIPEQVYLNTSGYEFLSGLDDKIKNKEIATPSFSGRAISAESILQLNPDLVILYEADSETINQLEGLGLNVYTVSSKNKEAIYLELKGLATLIGKSKRAEELIQYTENELNKINKAPKSDKKVYYAWSKGRIFSTSGKGSLIDAAIEAAGAQNACPLEMEATNISAETIYEWNPDLIILWNSKPEDVYSLKELQALPAVKQKQVYDFSPVFYYDPHTIKFMLFAKQLREWCEPQNTTAENDVKKDLKTLYGL